MDLERKKQKEKLLHEKNELFSDEKKRETSSERIDFRLSFVPFSVRGLAKTSRFLGACCIKKRNKRWIESLKNELFLSGIFIFSYADLIKR
ncbi:hypothetical protein BBH88_18630 (plasmid) [Planococcus antarcticus DSM 14505]|uniref:Uncharacterized protein n=1 Tax=Planococcus antarcticus DSM 14505 TaxID=1185653 RepID=A0ABM6DA41_9BACL|nr:hypothetical protein BBH88_18515 [Planococcus antarcticus DSM 14505]ANU12319.1 hypothetical protein BBH88_18630 [Planococcus antarcticus DSM 14505]